MERLTNRNLPMNGYLSNSKELRDYLDRLAAYEDTGLAPEEIEDIVEMFHSYRHICAGIEPYRLSELVKAEKEGRITIHPPARKCPQCRRNQLVARTDGKFYYCFGCKTQFAESEIQEARP